MPNPWREYSTPSDVHPAAFRALRHEPSGATLLLFWYADAELGKHWEWELRVGDLHCSMGAGANVSLPYVESLIAGWAGMWKS